MSFTTAANTITPVILCGGSGTRLWPLSRKSFPKQFVPLVDNKSLLQLTLERVAQINGSGPSPEVICVAAEEHRFLVAEAMQSAKVKGYIVHGIKRRGETFVTRKITRGLANISPRYFRPTEVASLLGDPAKAKEKLGWVPEVTLDNWCWRWLQPIWLMRKNIPCSNSMAIRLT
jgi:hypothetical protein